MTATLTDVCSDVVDCINRTAPESVDGDYYIVGTPAMRGNSINYSEARRVNQEVFAAWNRRLQPREGDLLIAREAPVGPVVRIPAGGHVGAGQRTTLLRPNPDIIDARFLFYYLTLPATQSRFVALGHGSTTPHVRVEDVRNFSLPRLPDRSTQRAIAEVLGALDDKIAANERLISSADDVVRAWYDQLSADAPDERSLGDMAVNVRDQVTPGDDPEGLYVGLEHLPRRRMWGGEWGAASQVDSAKSKFERGDVLFGKLRPYFHKVVASPGEGICSTDILVIRPKDGLGGLLLAAAASDGAVELANAHSAGTRMPRASWASLAQVQVAWPGDAQARTFSERVDVLSERCLGAARESRTLAGLRDALLPELMSGRLTVRDAESQVEEVV